MSYYYGKMPDWASSLKGLSANAKCIATTLLFLAGDKEVAWPSVPYLEKKYRISRSTANRALGELKKLKLVTVQYKKGSPNVYNVSVLQRKTPPDHLKHLVIRSDKSAYKVTDDQSDFDF